jgi:uncharacterized protein
LYNDFVLGRTGMVTNRVGPPVTGTDFFGRELEQERCWETLAADHLLLLAPRRVGKTSLMLRLEEAAAQRGFEATFLSAAGVQDEASFVQKLYEVVGELRMWTAVWRRLADGPAGRLLGKIQKIEAGGFSVELEPSEKDQWPILGERLARALDHHEGRCLILVDELPVFILSLLRQDPSGDRARRFLIWFRDLRQRSGRNGSLRWLLAGSIGLDTVTARLNFGDTINDLHIYHLGPFSRQTADALLEELSRTHNLPLSEEVRSHILHRVGWTIPYYLQLIFAGLRECSNGGGEPTVAHVDDVFEGLLKPAKKAYFDYWRQRLGDELGKLDAGHALTLLNTIAADELGASISSLMQSLEAQIHDARERREKLRYLLDVLESDGYIVQEGRDRFRFRSPLLREFWLRRVAP